MPILLIMYLFLLLLIAFLLTLLIDSLRFGITPTPTSLKVRNKILKALPNSIKGEIFELGSGFGNMAFALAQKFQLNQIKSYERAKIPYCVQKAWLFFRYKNNLSLIHKDFRNEDLSQAGLIFCYLYRDIMPFLAQKFEKELVLGTLVISHTFAIEKWKPIKILQAEDLYKTPIYIYRIE